MYFPFSHPDDLRLCSGWYCKCRFPGYDQRAESALITFFIKVLSVAFVICGFYLRYVMVSGRSYAFAPGWIISEPKIIRMTINRSCSCHNVDHIRNYGINVCIMTLIDFFVLSFWCLCVVVFLMSVFWSFLLSAARVDFKNKNEACSDRQRSHAGSTVLFYGGGRLYILFSCFCFFSQMAFLPNYYNYPNQLHKASEQYNNILNIFIAVDIVQNNSTSRSFY